LNITVFIAIIFLLGPIYVFGDLGTKKTEDSIKVLTLNALDLNGNRNIGDIKLGIIFEKFIDDNKPDIICLQEFSSTYKIPSIEKDYPYYYVNYRTRSTNYSPLTIFSKFPIIGKGSLDFPNTHNNSVYVDLVLPKDTLRVYNIHLQSLKVRPGSIKRERPYNLLNRLGSSYKMQLQQAETVKRHYMNSPYKTILCGDFNNTQYSGIVRLISNSMKDSFIEKGNGFGWTYYFKFLPFRIDYIFTDNSIEIVDHQNFDIELSDHYPVMATIKLGTH
jgi:endonuclease/exonuclease/phosphatase family metal-dependent hydrolase